MLKSQNRGDVNERVLNWVILRRRERLVCFGGKPVSLVIADRSGLKNEKTGCREIIVTKQSQPLSGTASHWSALLSRWHRASNDTACLADQEGILGHPSPLWCVAPANSRCALIYSRLSSMIVFHQRLLVEVVARYV